MFINGAGPYQVQVVRHEAPGPEAALVTVYRRKAFVEMAVFAGTDACAEVKSTAAPWPRLLDHPPHQGVMYFSGDGSKPSLLRGHASHNMNIRLTITSFWYNIFYA